MTESIIIIILKHIHGANYIIFMSFVILLSTCVMYIIIINDYIYNTVPLYTVYYIVFYIIIIFVILYKIIIIL